MKFFIGAAMFVFALLGVLANHETPQQVELGYDCVVYLPHVDYQGPDDFNNWLSTLPKFTNLDYSDGKWLADGKVVAYGASEDSAITNGKCGE